MPANLIYGLNVNKRMVHISTVATGLDCECICAGCKQRLVAKNNPVNINAPHFAHYSGNECVGALETMLHQLAKQIICDHNYITLPDGTVFHYNFSKPESTFDKYRADVLLKNEKQSLNVEVVVTSGLSDEKKRYLSRGTINTLIIDLQCIDREITASNLKTILLDEVSDKELIVPEYKNLLSKDESDSWIDYVLYGILAYIGYRVLKWFWKKLFG